MNTTSLRALSGLIWTSSGTIIEVVLRIAALVTLARLLSPTEFGIFAAAALVVEFVELLSGFGIGLSLIQHPNLTAAHTGTAFTATALSGCFFASLLWSLAPGIAHLFRMDGMSPVLRVLGLALPLSAISLVANSLLLKELRFRQSVITELSSFLSYAAVSIALALSGWEIWSLVAAYLAQKVVRITVLLSIQPHPIRPQLQIRAFKELVYFGGGVSAGYFCEYFAQQGDKLIVGRCLGASALGFYERSSNLLARLVTLFVRIWGKVLLVAMAKVQNERRDLAILYRHSVACNALVLLPLSAIFCQIAPELIGFMLGPEWTRSVVPFKILSLGMFFTAGYKISATVAHATGAIYSDAWRKAVYCALIMAGAGIGQWWGTAGVAWGVLGVLSVNYLLSAQLGLALTAMSWSSFLRAHWPGVRLTAIFSGEIQVVIMFARSLGLPYFAVVFAALLAVAATSLLMLRIVPGFFLGREGLDVFRKVVEHIPEKNRWIIGRFPCPHR